MCDIPWIFYALCSTALSAFTYGASVDVLNNNCGNQDLGPQAA